MEVEGVAVTGRMGGDSMDVVVLTIYSLVLSVRCE